MQKAFKWLFNNASDMKDFLVYSQCVMLLCNPFLIDG